MQALRSAVNCHVLEGSAESQYAREMYESRLSSAQAEVALLQDKFSKCLKRYERQSARLSRVQDSMRDATTDHDRLMSRIRALEAQKQVSEDLEHMLAEALRKQEDRYETLEISFDVLESAYSFLAAELVRTEHALKDALSSQKSVEGESATYQTDIIKEEGSFAEDETEATAYETDSEPDGGTDDHMRASTAMSSSTLSDFSWPATPGLLDRIGSRAALRSPMSSPIVMTPPLPALMLPSKPPTVGFPSAYPSSEPEEIFGSWLMLDNSPPST